MTTAVVRAATRTEGCAHSSSSSVGSSRRHVDGLYARYLKRAVDVIAASILLLVFLPFMLVVAVLIRILLGPHVIYRQLRVGRGRRSFILYKFRTMQPDRRVVTVRCEGVDRRVAHKRADDPRHTRIGRALRKSSIDELPQLWNVLWGHMSIVGPRPELSAVVEMYDANEHERHVVRPGITGLWQITARTAGPMRDYVYLDLAYIEQLSFRTDASILMRTIPAVLGRQTGR